MLFTLKNDVLQVTVNSLGAEIMSMRDKGGVNTYGKVIPSTGHSEPQFCFRSLAV